VKRAVRLKRFVILFFILFSIILCSKIYASEITADKIVVIKNKKVMILLRDGRILKAYKVALGKNNGFKVQEGDKKTPEGVYTITSRNPKSKYYRSLNISYPNSDDIERAKRLGVSPGNGIAIHGMPEDMAEIGSLHRLMNWTDGCIAVTNKEMDEIWRLVPDGTIVEIRH
jgi:murein L,D-transpeptidase YafK